MAISTPGLAGYKLLVSDPARGRQRLRTYWWQLEETERWLRGVYGCAREGTSAMLFDDMNWMAVIVGATLAFGLGMIWFSPVMFGRAWAAGNHGINPPASLPVTAMLIQGLGTFALALVVGLPDTGGLISTAVLAILAASLLVAGMAFSAKIPGRDADRRGLHCSDGRNHDLGSNPLAENNHLGVALTEAR